jgi:hypothetical protein
VYALRNSYVVILRVISVWYLNHAHVICMFDDYYLPLKARLASTITGLYSGRRITILLCTVILVVVAQLFYDFMMTST